MSPSRVSMAFDGLHQLHSTVFDHDYLLIATSDVRGTPGLDYCSITRRRTLQFQRSSAGTRP